MSHTGDWQDIWALAYASQKLWLPRERHMAQDCWLVLYLMWTRTDPGAIVELPRLSDTTFLSKRDLTTATHCLRRARMVDLVEGHSNCVVATPGNFVNWLVWHLSQCLVEFQNADTDRAQKQVELKCTQCQTEYTYMDHPRLMGQDGNLYCDVCGDGSVDSPIASQDAAASSLSHQHALPMLLDMALGCQQQRPSMAQERRTAHSTTDTASLSVHTADGSGNVPFEWHQSGKTLAAIIQTL